MREEEERGEEERREEGRGRERRRRRGEEERRGELHRRREIILCFLPLLYRSPAAERTKAFSFSFSSPLALHTPRP